MSNQSEINHESIIIEKEPILEENPSRFVLFPIKYINYGKPQKA